MKVVNLTKIKNKKALERILNQPKILKKYPHRNIIKYVADFKKEKKKSDYLCIVMELIEGNTLEDLIKHYKEEKKKFKTETIIDYFVQLVDIYSNLNVKGVAHKEIKVENMMITENEVLKLFDFGIAGEKCLIRLITLILIWYKQL